MHYFFLQRLFQSIDGCYIATRTQHLVYLKYRFRGILIITVFFSLEEKRFQFKQLVTFACKHILKVNALAKCRHCVFNKFRYAKNNFFLWRNVGWFCLLRVHKPTFIIEALNQEAWRSVTIFQQTVNIQRNMGPKKPIMNTTAYIYIYLFIHSFKRWTLLIRFSCG